MFADFDLKFFEIVGKYPHEVNKREMWRVINATHDFFYSLPFTPGAEDLWAYCKQHNPKFLTGLPSKQAFKHQKLRYVAEKFGPEYVCHVVPKADKQLFAGPRRVLVDDTALNIAQWQSKGGIGVLHVTGNAWKTIDALENLRKAL